MKVDLEQLPPARLEFMKPMLAKPDRLPSGPAWLYELKTRWLSYVGTEDAWRCYVRWRENSLR